MNAFKHINGVFGIEIVVHLDFSIIVKISIGLWKGFSVKYWFPGKKIPK